MTAHFPAPGDGVEEARERLALPFWTMDDQLSPTDGGLGDDGHVKLPLVLRDIGVVAQGVGLDAAAAADAAGRQMAAAPALALVWDAGTSDTNPGSGKARGNNASASATTYLYVSACDSNGTDITGSLTALGGSTSASKGRLRIVAAGSPAQYRDYVVTGVTAASGYYKVAVTWLAGIGVLTTGVAVGIGWVPTGDKGDTGTPGSVWYSGSAAPSTALGVNGDRYHRVATGDVYVMAAGSWGSPYANIRGADGTNGAGPVWYGTSTGSANAQVLAGPLASLTGNPSVEFIAGYSNTSTTVYLTVGSTPQTRLKDASGADPAVGAIVAGTKYVATDDGAYWRLAGSGAALDAGADGSLLIRSGGAWVSLPQGANGQALMTGGSGPAWTTLPISLTVWATVAADITLENAGLTAVKGTGSTNRSALINTAITGKKYGEVLVATSGGGSNAVGIAQASMTLTSYVGSDAGSYCYYDNGYKYTAGSGVTLGSSWAAAGTYIVGWAFDSAAGKLWFSLGGVWLGSGDPAAGTNPAFVVGAGTYYLAGTLYVPGTKMTLRPSAASWSFAAPSGFGGS